MYPGYRAEQACSSPSLLELRGRLAEGIVGLTTERSESVDNWYILNCMQMRD